MGDATPPYQGGLVATDRLERAMFAFRCCVSYGKKKMLVQHQFQPLKRKRPPARPLGGDPGASLSTVFYTPYKKKRSVSYHTSTFFFRDPCQTMGRCAWCRAPAAVDPPGRGPRPVRYFCSSLFLCELLFPSLLGGLLFSSILCRLWVFVHPASGGRIVGCGHHPELRSQLNIFRFESF